MKKDTHSVYISLWIWCPLPQVWGSKKRWRPKWLKYMYTQTPKKMYVVPVRRTCISYTCTRVCKKASKPNKKADKRRVRRRYPFSFYKVIGIHVSFPGLFEYIHFVSVFISFQSSFRINYLCMFVCMQRGTARAKLPEAIGLHVTVCFIILFAPTSIF